MPDTPTPPADKVSSLSRPSNGDPSSLSASVRRGAVWSVLGTLLLRLANISITAVVAHILDPHDFGVFAVALTAYTIISALGQGGVASCLMRADLDIDTLAPTMVTVSLMTGVIFAGGLAIFARQIASALGSVDGTDPIRVMAVVLFLEAAFAVPWSQLTRDFKQNKLFLANAISLVPSTAALLLLAKSGDGAMAFAWSRVITTFVGGCVMVASVPKWYRPGITRSGLAVFFTFGIPLVGVGFVNYVLLNVDYALIGHLLGAVALGVYVLAFNVSSWPAGLVGGAVGNISMPAFSRVKHDPDLLKDAVTRSLRAVSLIVLPMCGLMMVLARPLVLTLYGAKWIASSEALSILSIYGAISVIGILFGNILAGLGKVKAMLAVQLLWLGALVPAMVIGVRQDGIDGAAIAHVAVIVPLVLPSWMFVLRKATGVRFTMLGRAIFPPLLVASAAALAAKVTASHFVSPLIQLLTGLVVGCLIYAVAAFPQGLALLSQEQGAKLHAFRLLRFYMTAARSVRLYQSALEHHGPQLRINRPDLVLTDSYRPEGWLVQAVSVHERTLADQERLLGPDDPHTVASRANLAYAYRQRGRLTEAIALYERTLADWRRLLGPDHPRTLRSSNYLASAYHDAGRLAEAIALYERTLADRVRLLGPDHPSTLRSSNYLAGAYHDAGRLAEAIPLYEQAHAGWLRLLGPDHPSTLRSGNYLAGAYHDTGRLAEAIPLYEQAHAGWLRLLGPDHPSTLRSSNYLACAYGEVGRLAEAIPLYKQTLARCDRVLGSDHALSRTVNRNLSVAQQLAVNRRPQPGWPDVSSAAARDLTTMWPSQGPR